tara:strand:- start:43 stop:303 length:261 start_codon:yes stop_codon:yes gene_type:complete
MYNIKKCFNKLKANFKRYKICIIYFNKLKKLLMCNICKRNKDLHKYNNEILCWDCAYINNTREETWTLYGSSSGIGPDYNFNDGDW